MSKNTGMTADFNDLSGLTPKLKRVANYIKINMELFLDSSALEIASATGTSDATVIRTLQAMGFSGLDEAKKHFKNAEQRQKAESKTLSNIHSNVLAESEISISRVLEGYEQGRGALSSTENKPAITHAVHLIHKSRQVALFGMGSAGMAARYGAQLLHDAGKASHLLVSAGADITNELEGLNSCDLLIMMVQKSKHHEGRSAIKEASRLNIPVILLTQQAESYYVEVADCVINIPRTEGKKHMWLHGTVFICLELLIQMASSIRI